MSLRDKIAAAIHWLTGIGMLILFVVSSSEFATSGVSDEWVCRSWFERVIIAGFLTYIEGCLFISVHLLLITAIAGPENQKERKDILSRVLPDWVEYVLSPTVSVFPIVFYQQLVFGNDLLWYIYDFIGSL